MILAAVASGGVEAAGVWIGIVVGVITAIGIAATLLLTVKSQARQQDAAEYTRGYREGVNSCQPELWSLRGQLGITRAPYQPYQDHTTEGASE